jgi:hypothetical protein
LPRSKFDKLDLVKKIVLYRYFNLEKQGFDLFWSRNNPKSAVNHGCEVATTDIGGRFGTFVFPVDFTKLARFDSAIE